MSRKAVAAVLPSVEGVKSKPRAQEPPQTEENQQQVKPQAQEQAQEQAEHATVMGWVQSQPQSQPTLAESDLVYESQHPRQILVELPFGRPPSPNESARTGHLNLKGLSTHQRYGLLCLRDGLSRAGAKLKNGTPVDRPSHVIRYILEQAIDQAVQS